MGLGFELGVRVWGFRSLDLFFFFGLLRVSDPSLIGVCCSPSIEIILGFEFGADAMSLFMMQSSTATAGRCTWAYNGFRFHSHKEAVEESSVLNP